MINTFMDIKKYILPALAVAALCVLSSCKKDKTETYSYLTGDPEFSLPVYGVAGDTFSFKVGGVTADDGSNVGYYWYASPVQTARDTSDTYTITLPDTLCTVSIHCVAFADGYYSNTVSHDITIVKPGRENGSISGLDAGGEKDFIFKDPRDGREYLCTTLGDTDWFRENLSYGKAGAPLANCEATSEVFGRFYTWQEAVVSCPEGWRLSSLDDWADAASVVLGQRPGPQDRYYSAAGAFMGNLSFNGKKMWEYWPDVKITDQLGLSVIPLGFASRMESTTEFRSMYDYAAFWTADEKDGEQAFYRYFFDESPDLFIGSSSKGSFAANVRCVRDHE